MDATDQMTGFLSLLMCRVKGKVCSPNAQEMTVCVLCNHLTSGFIVPSLSSFCLLTSSLVLVYFDLAAWYPFCFSEFFSF